MFITLVGNYYFYFFPLFSFIYLHTFDCVLYHINDIIGAFCIEYITDINVVLMHDISRYIT